MAAKVLRDDVVALCQALGYKAAAEWKRQRMQEQLVKIGTTPDIKPDDVDDKDQQALLKLIIDNKGVVDVVRSADEMTETAGATDAAEEKPEPVVDKTEVVETTTEPVKATKAKKAPKPKEEKVKVDRMSRHKAAARALKELGLTAGIKELTDRANEIHGSPAYNMDWMLGVLRVAIEEYTSK